MGKPIMIILGVVFGMALLAILYTAFRNPIDSMGDSIMDKAGNILSDVNISMTVSPFKAGLNWILH